MSDAITTLLVQIKGDATGAVQAFKDFATASTTATAQVNIAATSASGARKALKGLADDTEKAGTHIAGLSYYFRSGMDQVRMALMGGGTRAGFYAVDELIRGLVSSGVGLGTLIPIIGAIAAALGAGWIAWEEWTKGEREAAEQAKELADTWKTLPGLIRQINDMQREGLLSPQAAGQYADYLTGRKKLYVDNEGNVTNQPTRQIQVQQDSSPIGGPWGTSTRTETVNNEELNPTDPRIRTWVMNNATAGGTVSKEYLDTLKQADELIQKINEESLTGLEKQKQEIRDKGEKERDELQSALEIAKAHMTAADPASGAKVQQIRQAIVQSFQNQSQDIAALEQSSKEKLVKQQLEAAQKAVDAIDQQQKKQEAADKQHEDELQRQAQLTRDIARSDLEDQIESVKANALMTDQEKLATVTALNAQLKKLNDAEIQELTALKGQAKSLSDQLELEKKIADLKHQNNQIDNQTTPDEQNSFGFQFSKAFTGQQNKWTGWAQESADAFSNAWSGATNSVSGGLTHLFEYGAQKGQWFREIWNGVIGSMISSVTKLAVDWVAQHVVMQGVSMAFHGVENALTAQSVATHTAGEAAKTTATTGNSAIRQGVMMAETIFHGVMVALRVAAHLAGEVASTAITAAQAVLRAMYHAIVAAIAAMESEASVPYVGVILGIAAGAAIMAAAMGLMGGFKEGGYTGTGHPDQVAGVVHAGEYVIPANRTAQSMRLLSAIHSGELSDAAGPRAGSFTPPMAKDASQAGGTTQIKTSHYIYTDKAKMARAIEQDDAHEKWVADVAARTVSKMNS